MADKPPSLWQEFSKGVRQGRKDAERGITVGTVTLAAVALPVLAGVDLARRVRDAFKDHDAERRKKEYEETRRLFDEAKRAYDASRASQIDPERIVEVVVTRAIQGSDRLPSTESIKSLVLLVDRLMIEDGLSGLPSVDWSEEWTTEHGVLLRNYLRRQIRFFGDYEHFITLWGEKLSDLLKEFLERVPHGLWDDDESEPDKRFGVEMPLISVVEDPAEAVERLFTAFFDDRLSDAKLFEWTRERLMTNCLRASGIDPAGTYPKRSKLVFPTEARNLPAEELAGTYFAGTNLLDLLTHPVAFRFPEASRFEHCHIVAGTGHGKTQLLQLLVHEDLQKVREGKASVVVVDSQGDLIRTISHLAIFSPAAEKSLADRLALIDPNDIEYPVALNMFDLDRDRIGGYSPVEQEKILNGTIELYEYIFGALLGAELTQKQGVIFRYLARLMLQIPGATVQTLLELMEDGRPFKPYMEELSGTSRKFFETQFFHPSFNATKHQILKRLWGVLSNTTFERMFSNPRNKVDMFEAMNGGKVILINTAKDLLKQEGCEIFGRFFIAMIAQAALERAVIPPDKRVPTFVYIDEAQDYFDENIGHLLNQARKYKVAMHLAHQDLGQLGQSLKASVMANTSIKLAGGVSAADASAFAREMRCDADFVQGMRKRKSTTEFACFVKHLTPQAVKITVPLGSVEKLPGISEAEYEALIGGNRNRYSSPVEEILKRQAEPPDQLRAPRVLHHPEEREAKIDSQADLRAEMRADEPRIPKEKAARKVPRPMGAPPALGRGGKQHQYLQNIVKQLAQDRGYRAVIEEEILDGSARVDVSLTKADVRIACEISVTTSAEHELQNVGRCLAAGYDEVILIAPDLSHLRKLERVVTENLSPEDDGRVSFLDPASVAGHLDQRQAEAQTREVTIAGYKVTTTHKRLDPAEAESRRKAVANIIARSMKDMQESSKRSRRKEGPEPRG